MHNQASVETRKARASLQSEIQPEIQPEPEHKSEPEEENTSRSLLSGLTGKMRRKSSKQPDEPQNIDEHSAPPINPLEELESEFADEPLEPGSGAPDINSIMQRVREVQKASANQQPSSENSRSPAENIASARRAALAAAAEVESLKPDDLPANSRGKAKDKLDGASKKPLVRKPVIIAACAILVAILSFPIVKQLSIFNEPGPQLSASQVQDEQEPALIFDQQASSGDQVPILEAPQNTSTQAADFGPRVVDPIVEQNVANNLEQTLETVPSLDDITVGDGLDVAQQNPNQGLEIQPNGETIQLPVTELNANGAQQIETEVSTEISTETSIYASAVERLPDTLASLPLKQAALAGDPVALYEIGARYADGKGTQVSAENAVEWLRFATDQNFAPAQYRLGNMYEKGVGVPRDLDKAKNYYRGAAGNGNVSAMHNLGVLYASGGTADDLAQAASWFKQAAEHGVRDSQVNIAILYARGEGVARDFIESYKWFAVAANDGDQDAAVKRDQVFNTLPEDRAKIAKEKVATWQPKPIDQSANDVLIPDAWNGEATNTATIDMKKAIMNIQAILNNNGFDAGQPDGVIGKNTIRAIKEFQTSVGMEADGKITDELVQELLKRNG